MIKRLSVFVSALVLGLVSVATGASAAGRSEPWQLWLQDAASPSMERISEFNNLLLVIEVAIVIFVLAIMAYIVVRFNAKANPVPSKTTHNTLLEIVWTAVPILILVVIAVPSLKHLYFTDHIEKADMTLKVMGNQWYWSYEYPDSDGLEFDSVLVPEEDLEKGQPRLLTVDNVVVLPIQTNVRLLLTSNDVIHNWAVPSLGLKLDTMPGRTNETWVRINKEGSYYGMCSELCGVNHGFMPIHVKGVSKEAYKAWVVKAKKEFATNETRPSKVVAAGSARASDVRN